MTVLSDTCIIGASMSTHKEKILRSALVSSSVKIGVWLV